MDEECAAGCRERHCRGSFCEPGYWRCLLGCASAEEAARLASLYYALGLIG